MQEGEIGDEDEAHQWTTGGTGGGGRLNMGKELVDAFLEGTATGVDKDDDPGEFEPWEWQDSHPSSEVATLEFEASSVKVGVSPKGLGPP